MIRIELEDKKYVVPTEFKDLDIGTFQKLDEVDKTANDKTRVIDYIHILTGIDKKLIMGIDIIYIRQLMKNFKFLSIDKNDFDIIEAVKIDKIYKLDKELYNMRFDMFIDLEEMTKDKDSVINNLHLIMAILYRPTIKKKWWKRKLVIEPYDSESVKERAEFFKNNLMMDKVMGALFFFINLKMKYIQDTEDFLTQEMKEMNEKMTEKI